MLAPFLHLHGQAEEAMPLYEQAFGAVDKVVSRFKDAPPHPDHPLPEEMREWVLHGELTLLGSRLLVSDSPDGESRPGERITLAAVLEDPQDVERAFELLKVGGDVFTAPAPMFFTRMFCAVKDRFGVTWHVYCG